MAYILPIPPRPLHRLIPDIERPLGLPSQLPGTRRGGHHPTVYLSILILVPRDGKLRRGIEKPGLCTLALDGPHAPANLPRAAIECAANRSARPASVIVRQHARGDRAGCVGAGLVLLVVLVCVYARDLVSGFLVFLWDFYSASWGEGS